MTKSQTAEIKMQCPEFWKINKSIWPILVPDLDIIKTNILKAAEANNSPLECQQDFHSIWSSHLLLYLTWPIFELGLHIIKTNILKKFQDAPVKNATSRVLTRCSFNLTLWPVFDSIWLTHIRTWPRYHSDKHSDKMSSCWSKTFRL